jgi:1,4-alpha-glucan branching enzyme
MDLHLFNEGTHVRLYQRLGAHAAEQDGAAGTRFALWAPNAAEVSVVGDFNDWRPAQHPLTRVGASGLWQGFVAGVGKGAVYKYHLQSQLEDYVVDKADPFARMAETPPSTASVVWHDDYRWHDEEWLRRRKERNSTKAPIAIYELHLGSWRRSPDDGRMLSYREIAPQLAQHLAALNFTHVELLPVMEHPFYGSWGYQTTGYYAPSSRYGSPDDLKYLIDYLHQHGFGVILDWVPSHFPTDEHSIGYFDGTHLYEHADPRQGHHPDWKSSIFNYGRNEVRSFLMSSAHFWLDEFHADGLRVDAVASMLYLDYSRADGEWVPNRYGGRENLEALSFLRELNDSVHERFDGAITIAEESTAWPGVSRASALGGLGFDFKWDMGWMHDTLAYMALDPIHRRFHHDKLTFRGMYATSEQFMLPLSHDEVVHGKGSLLGKMAGDRWQKLANLRLLLAFMCGTPGKKLLFMGAELGQWSEWNHDAMLDWLLLDHPDHRGITRCLADLNRLYRDTPAMHQLDGHADGFRWVDCNDSLQSTLAFLRYGEDEDSPVLVVCNFTPVIRHGFRVGVPSSGHWREMLNTDATIYGGSGVGNLGGLEAKAIEAHGHDQSIDLTLPPLTALFFRRDETKSDPDT